MDSIEITDEEHQRYVDAVKANRDLVEKKSMDFKLEMYGNGKQGSFGDNSKPKPGMF